MDQKNNHNDIYFNSEKELEDAIIKHLEANYRVDKKIEFLNENSENQYGKTIYGKTHQDLKQNWCNILNNINANILDGYKLKVKHIDMILKQCAKFNLTELTNKVLKYGSLPKIAYFKDDYNEDKEYSLVLFKNGGSNQNILGNNDSVGNFLNTKDPVYQIARQVRFNDIDGRIIPDIILLINGLPVLIIELKLRGTDTHLAIQQLKNYNQYISNYNARESQLTMLNFVQILSAMTEKNMYYTPNQTDYNNIPSNITDWLYFTSWNPTDKKNKPIHKWNEVVKYFFNIPTVHDMVSKYTVENIQNDKLFLLRSYQYHAIHNILEKLEQSYRNDDQESKVGYVWHTTGSGKTLTSFKLAQLLKERYSNKKIFIVIDRVALASQTEDEYNRFSNNSEDIKITKTQNSYNLKREISSNTNNQKIIITSIQKIKKIYDTLSENVIENNKRRSKDFIFIFDEAHRSTEGTQFASFKEMFPHSKFIGFTGTPIMNDDVNERLEKETTKSIFGDLMHSYTIKDGIKDKKVLPFKIFIDYPKYLVKLFSSASNIEELEKSDKDKNKLLSLYQDYRKFVKEDESGKLSFEELEITKKTIEDKYNIKLKNLDYSENSEYDLLIGVDENNFDEAIKIEKKLKEMNFYDNNAYKSWIVEELIQKIISNKKSGGRLHKYSSLFAVESKDDAIKYFNIFEQKLKEYKHKVNFTLLFDFSESNTEKGVIEKKEFYTKMLNNYNNTFKTNFDIDHLNDLYKEDILKRLKQEGNNYRISSKDDINNKKLDILIVVDQLLTGYDSKYIDTIYFDKHISQDYLLIQAISRTNRILLQTQEEKATTWPKESGKIRFFRQGATMKYILNKAFKKYGNENNSEENNVWISELKPEKIKNKINNHWTFINEISNKIGFKNDFNKLPDKLYDELTKYKETKKETEIIKNAKYFKNYANELLKTWIQFSNLEVEEKNQIIDDIKITFKLDDTIQILRIVEKIKNRAEEISDIINSKDGENNDKDDIYNIINEEFLKDCETFLSEKPDEIIDNEYLEKNIENEQKLEISRDQINDALAKFSYVDQEFLNDKISELKFTSILELEEFISEKIQERTQKEIEQKYTFFSNATGLTNQEIDHFISEFLESPDTKSIIRDNMHKKIIENTNKNNEILENYYQYCQSNFNINVSANNPSKISGSNSKKCIWSFVESNIKK
ncbi:DEAD/DEAH box helicase family protein [Mycoplasma sp. OR1901]|uniref:type I restriction enzyme subunit R domain-containing protein n=1 Tax=Mycoplasma sp. OR1901 TaxID=2742195 RepID=UPI001583BD11|nr:DEAD/DEAH box helicase family protein [Mycoplasma sp. OR1901]QKT05335.1 type I restriction endonuclease subunit R [Mycoplasma sp. OR1901]